MTLQVAIVPAGAWGTALAVPAAANGHDVRLWRRAQGWPEGWDRGHKALPGLALPENVRGCSSVEEAVSGAALVILGPASVALREHCALIKPFLRADAVIVVITKGLEPETHLRVSEVVAQELPAHAGRIVALSGPNFAHEVAAGLPTGTVVACADLAVAELAQDALMSARFRIYTNPDMIGVELAGALKNVMALGVGISDGLGFGDNARAALITRGLTEMGRLGTVMGANVLTFAGLAGMGDLVLTCTSDSSRNRQAGLAIGRGEDVSRWVGQTSLTVEGVRTTRAAWELAREAGVQLPITEVIYAVLYEDLSPMEGMKRLMGRQKTHELEELLRNPLL